MGNLIAVVTEKQRNAPEPCQRYHNVDDSGKNGTLTAAYPGYKVKGKQADGTPVESADDGDQQRNFIHDHHSYI